MLKKPFMCGLLASLFFAVTFVLNRSMNLEGGYWMWSACLRYIFMLPMLLLLVWWQGRTGSRTNRPGAVGGQHSPGESGVSGSRTNRPGATGARHQSDINTHSGNPTAVGAVLQAIRSCPGRWIVWSTVGFGLFYLPLTMASVYGESWFVAATWQMTIVCGVLLTPLFGKKIPFRNLAWSAVILTGIFMMQASRFMGIDPGEAWKPLVLIVIAAFSYPLGNRKMMLCCPPELTSIQRVFGMNLCSMPFWILFSVISGVTHGAPGTSQIVQSLLVALFSGVVATVLFFKATDMVKQNQRHLALVEATQSGEVLFTLLGGILLLHDSMPTGIGLAGIAVIILGMVGNSLAAGK